MSYNAWLFVENNPVNYSDPSGRWRWALTGSLYHLLIENWYERTPGGLGNPAIQLEYPIPGTAFRRPDMFNVATGDICEIEPFYLVPAGASQVIGYQASLNAAASAGLLDGTYAFFFDYDWNSTRFHIGGRLGWPGRYWLPYPPAPVFDLVADYVDEGVIAYWLEPNAGFYVLVATGITARVSNMRLVRPPDWAPQPAYQPAYVLDFDLACRTALILAGRAIMIYTLANDASVVGIADDVATVPVGLFFISLGTNEAFFVPAEETSPGEAQ